MSDNVKNMEASVRARLLNIAKEEKLNFDFILLMFMQERLLYRLSISEYRDQFVLKGGLLILSTLNIKTRPTRDIDFLAQNVSNDLEKIKQVFSQISQIQINDGVSYDKDSIEVEKITEGADYDGVRIKISGFISNARKNLQLDLGFGDVIVPGEVNMEYPRLLDFEIPSVKAYSIESVIAEKFEAMLSLSVINSRMKDFYDVFTLSKSQSFEGEILSQAIAATLKNRGTVIEEDQVIFDEDFAQDENRNRLWQGYLRKIGKESINFNLVMGRIKRFLEPVYISILENREFKGEWNNERGEWTV
ncbi:MAG: nucleotidyl transferase AbiEii/AbiGii toxin family protein [Halanaerobium sp.]